MNVATKGWTAQIDRMPGNPSFRTFGTVTVHNSGITPRLIKSDLQDKSFNLRLDLVLEHANEPALQVLTEHHVEYKVLGDSNVTGVSIFYEDKLLTHISDILITH